MIQGTLDENLSPRIPLVVLGPSGREIQINATVDTGFNGYLTLSARLLAELGCPEVDEMETILADGSVSPVVIHEGSVIWDGAERRILIDASEGGSLVGMGLLEGYDVMLRVREGGFIRIVPTPVGEV